MINGCGIDIDWKLKMTIGDEKHTDGEHLLTYESLIGLRRSHLSLSTCRV